MIFQKFGGPMVRYGFSERRDGSMHRYLEKENQEQYFQSIGIDPKRVVVADLIHGTNVFLASDESAGKLIPRTDALITKNIDLFLSVTGADCFPIYFYDPVRKVVGIAHAGWRGILGNIAKKTIEEMSEQFKTVPRNLLVGIGPGIRECHFEISLLDKEKYKEYPMYITERKGSVFIDLAGIICSQLRSVGVLGENTEDCGLCTYCKKESYFSYRRDKPLEIQPMVGYIGFL